MKTLRSFGLILHTALTGYMARSGLMAFAIAPTLDKTAHAALPESQRGWYAADGEGFKLDPTSSALLTALEDTGGLKTALEKTRTEVKDAKAAAKQAVADALKAFEGIDPVKTRALLSKFDNEEEAALIAAGRIDDVIAKRMSKRDAAQQKLVTDAMATRDAAMAEANEFRSGALDDKIRAAAAKAGLHPFAIEDALLRARSIFSLDAKRNVVQLGSDGVPVLGKDGKTPFTPSEWLDAMREAAPHWFPAGGTGGGAGGSGGAASGRDLSHLTPVERMNAARQMKKA